MMTLATSTWQISASRKMGTRMRWCSLLGTAQARMTGHKAVPPVGEKGTRKYSLKALYQQEQCNLCRHRDRLNGLIPTTTHRDLSLRHPTSQWPDLAQAHNMGGRNPNNREPDLLKGGRDQLEATCFHRIACTRRNRQHPTA